MNLKPMLATEAPASRIPAFVGDPAWALQEKIDGHRVLLSIDSDGTITAAGRDGQPSQHGALFLDVARRSVLASLSPGRSVTLDGELVERGTLWVFDLLFYDGRAAGPLAAPFCERSAVLTRLFDRWTPPERLFRLVPTAFTHEAKAEVALECVRRPAEGVIARRLAAPYKPGHAHGLVKMKFVKEADLVVTSLRHEGKDNAVLGAYEAGNPEPVEVGRASTNGKGVIARGDVVLVRYQRFTEGGRLREPRIMARRTDKAASECTIDQLLGGTP